MQENRRRGGAGWIGWVFFFLLIFGSRLAPPVANWLSQQTGLNITPSGVMGALALLYIASLIAGPIISALLRNSGGEPSAPTMPSLPQSSTTTSRPPFPPAGTPSLPQQSSVRLPPVTSAKTPGAPRWEPIIDPRILVFGIVGVILLGGFLLVVLLFAGSI